MAVFAQTDFQELSLEEACKKAKTENKPKFLDCYTSWCGPCKMLAPVMEELSEEMAGQVEFYNADTDENMDLALANKVTSIPALFLLRDGQIVDRMIGFQSKQALKNWIGGTQ